MSLVKARQWRIIKPLSIIVSSRFKPVVVDTDLLVGVPYAYVQFKIVMEGVTIGEVELSESSILYVDFHPGGAEEKPEDEGGDGDNDGNGDDELEQGSQQAAWAAATTRPPTRSMIAVGRRDWRAIVGSIQRDLFCFAHIEF